MTKLELLIYYAKSWMGTPYHWGLEHGGDDFLGMDCSGFVSEVLQGVGIFKNRQRMTAHDIYEFFCKIYNIDPIRPFNSLNGMFVSQRPKAGWLQFFLDNRNQVYHVNICINDQYVVGAIGGNSKTKDDRTAAEQNAFIKIRPFDYTLKPSMVVYIKPCADIG